MKKEFILLLLICPIVFFYVFSSSMRHFKKEQKTYLSLNDSFEKMLGSETDNWNYIQTQQDYKDLEFYKDLYKKNYKCQFNSNSGFKIPKTIHVIWVGPKCFPIDSVENMRTWIAHHPDWTFNFWTDRDRPPPCNGMKVRLFQDFNFKFLGAKYAESQNWGEKSDIWRYEIMFQEGGLYIDHDAVCIRPFHGLHKGYDFYAGLEMPHEGIDSLSLTLGIGLFGSKPKHPVIYETIQMVLDRWDMITKKFSSTDSLAQARRVTHRTLIPLTHAFKKDMYNPENTDIIFPATYFYPKGLISGFYSEHLYSTTWNNLNPSDNEKFFHKMLRYLKNRDAKIIRVEIMSLFALVGCFVIYLLINREVKKRDSHHENT